MKTERNCKIVLSEAIIKRKNTTFFYSCEIYAKL